MDDKKKLEVANYLCPHCNGHTADFEKYLKDILDKTSDQEISQKEIVCMTCAAHFTIGDKKFKVEGVKSDEVKDVALHLMNHANEQEKNGKEFVQKLRLKKELTNDKLKQLFVIGGFWIGAFLGLGYFLLQVSTKSIDWYRYIGVLFALPIFFTLVGAFILKMTSSLKEESFLQIIRLTLNLNFKGLQYLTKTKKDESQT